MPSNRRTSRILVTSVAAAALFFAGLHPATSQSRRGGPPAARGAGALALRDGQTVIFASPQFVAHAISFKALDETGPDWPGSDEVKAVFADFNSINETVTDEYGDVDSGETKRFRSGERCIARQPGCEKGASTLHFGIGLWEQDSSFPGASFCAGTLQGYIYAYYEEHGPCGWPNDLIGRVEVKLDEAQLIAALPNVGDSADSTVKVRGGSGSYEVTYRISRLANAERSIVIHLPPIDPAPTITLQGMGTAAAGPRRAVLTWTGATTSTVDIFRNSVKVVTTANDGAHDDVVTSGTYQYRLCNLNSTTACSPTISVTVP